MFLQLALLCEFCLIPDEPAEIYSMGDIVKGARQTILGQKAAASNLISEFWMLPVTHPMTSS